MVLINSANYLPNFGNISLYGDFLLIRRVREARPAGTGIRIRPAPTVVSDCCSGRPDTAKVSTLCREAGLGPK